MLNNSWAHLPERSYHCHHCKCGYYGHTVSNPPTVMKALSNISFLPPLKKRALTRGEGGNISVVCGIIILWFKCRAFAGRVFASWACSKWIGQPVPFFWWSQRFFFVFIQQSIPLLSANKSKEWVFGCWFRSSMWYSIMGWIEWRKMMRSFSLVSRDTQKRAAIAVVTQLELRPRSIQFKANSKTQLPFFSVS